MHRELIVLLNGERAGRVLMDSGGKYELVYEDTWRERPDAYPVSLSMPLLLTRHKDPEVRPFLEGLLPDNRHVLERWGRDFQVAWRNPFALLSHIGEDCAGAIQLVHEERVEAITTPLKHQLEHVEWLSETEVADRLRDAVDRHGTGRLGPDVGHFSLAGAQPKTALLFDSERWGIPHGSVPTTHIIKPPALRDFEAFDLNEHFCLRLASKLGLRAAHSSIQTFDGTRAIVVERYDREWTSRGRLVRLHQEDACQALAVSPTLKYENEGGPGIPDLAELLDDHSTNQRADLGALVDAAALNWAIGGTDAHAKNYSILLGPGSTRLAPLYDIGSALPYPDQIHPRKMKLAMRVDREYHVWKIERRHWEGLAERCRLDPGPFIDRVAEVLAAVPTAASEAAEEVRAHGVDDAFLDRLEGAIISHAQRCLNKLT